VKKELNCNIGSILDVADKVFENYTYKLYKNKIEFVVNHCKSFSVPINIRLSDKQLEKSLRKYKATAQNKCVQYARNTKYQGFEVAEQSFNKELIG
jgi:hypothetical protein